MLITTQKELNARVKAFKGLAFITVDTEFLREKTYYPKLCLIQISGPDKDAVAIDPLAEGGLDLSPVFEILRDKNTLKIFHAARADMEIFFQIMDGDLPSPIFDTQIAAMVCGYGDSVGYESLVQNILNKSLDKSVQYTNWAHRPLSTRQIDYALADVTHLVDIYRHLAAQLEKQKRTSWVFEEEAILTNPATYSVDPQESWQRVKIRSPKPKNLAVLRALAAWREEEAQRRDMPKSWIMRDETLADIAGQIPTNPESMKKIRNIPGDIAQSKLGGTLLSVIKKALDSPQEDWPKLDKKKPLPPSAAAAVDILKMLLKIQAAQHGVAAKLIASSEDLERLVMEENTDSPVLKGWRAEVFGKEALALKNGELAIGFKKSKIVKYRVTPDMGLA